MSLSQMAVQSFRGYFLLSLAASSAISVACMFVMAKAYQTGWIPTPSEGYQLPVYWLLWHGKRLWGRATWVLHGSTPGIYPLRVSPKLIDPSEEAIGGAPEQGVFDRLRIAMRGHSSG